MTLKEGRDQVIIELGNRTDVDDTIDDQYNYAVQEVCSMYEHPEYQNSATTALRLNAYKYLLPADFYAIIGVYEEVKNYELRRSHKWTFEQLDETNTGPNGPHTFAIFNKALYVFNKIPDADAETAGLTLRIDYWASQSELTDGANSHLLPIWWERGIRLKASAFTHRILDMDDKAQDRQGEFDRWASRITTSKSQEKINARDARMVPTRG